MPLTMRSMQRSVTLAKPFLQPCFYGKIIYEHVTIEEYIEGSFKKYVNNDGNICDVFSDMREKAETFVHFIFQKSKRKLMITDIQGVGMVLCDPEIDNRVIRLSERGRNVFLHWEFIYSCHSAV